jgi:hypothetical protein
MYFGEIVLLNTRIKYMCIIFVVENNRFNCVCQYIRGKNGSTEGSKGNKTVPGKVATTRTEDGHKQNTKTSVKMYTRRKKKHRTTEEELEGPTSS